VNFESVLRAVWLDGGMRTHPIIRPLAAALLAACALAVAACGGDDPAGGASSAADRDNEARDAQLEYARCMRDHGIDMPDPTFDGDGRSLQTGPDPADLKDLKRGKFREAEQACKKYLEAIEPPKLSEEQQQEFRDAALANARCMREHGIENFPDPTFGENGEARIKAGPGSGIDPEDPDFREAMEACKDTMPKVDEDDNDPAPQGTSEESAK
jgi:hypothetical protein